MNDRPREEPGMTGAEPSGPKTARPVGCEPDSPGGPARLTARRAVGEILVVFSALLLAVLGRFFFWGVGPDDSTGELGYWLYGSVLINGSVALAAIGAVLVVGGYSRRSVGLHLHDLSGQIAAAVVALIAIYALQFAVGLVVDFFWPHLVRQAAAERIELARMFPRLAPGYLLLFTLFVGFYEELLFRGFLITRLTAVVANRGAALVISSIFFGIIHYYQDPLAMFQIFTVALILGALFLLRASLVSPILVHTAFDFINLMVAMYYLEKIAP